MSKKPSNSKSGGNPPSGLPLLYSKPQMLDSKRHAQSCIITKDNFSFAKKTNSLPINTIEFIEAAKTYPIVFTGDENPLPVAMVGMEKYNYFVKPDNTWQENTYIPGYVRQYPFILFENPKAEKFFLCVDEEAPHFSNEAAKGANALFGKDGKASKFTDNALKFCTTFYQHHLITRNFCADLKANKLLQPYQSEVTLASGRKAQIAGFQMIDEKALNALPNKTYLLFREKGWIPFIYLALASTSNWKNLIAFEAKATGSITR